MNVSGALPYSIVVSYQDEEWTQSLDYEHILFKCRMFHVHDHLFRDFPLNVPNLVNKAKKDTNPKGFTKMPHKRKVG
jgi:hypothetical protein